MGNWSEFGTADHQFSNGQRLGRLAWEQMNVSLSAMSPEQQGAFLDGFAAGVTEDINNRTRPLFAATSHEMSRV